MNEPWWNDMDKVAGLLTTIVMVTVVAVVCMVVIAGAARWLF